MKQNKVKSNFAISVIAVTSISVSLAGQFISTSNVYAASIGPGGSGTGQSGGGCTHNNRCSHFSIICHLSHNHFLSNFLNKFRL